MAAEKTEKESKVNLNRASRNKSEKDRRDKVNSFINELASLVPGCLPESKKLDKATILKNTVDFMKVHNDLTVAITRKDTTCYLNGNELGQLMLEGCCAFLFTISLSGNFKFLSESVYDLLGYTKDDLIEKNMFDYLCPEDKLILLKEISRSNRAGVARNSGTSSFFIRFKTRYSEKPFFETLHCCGNFRMIKEEVKSNNDGSTVVNSNETCFVALASLVQANCELDITSWVDVEFEFTSRQSLDGKFLYLDPRCIPITGYLPYEILGSMIYEFIHFDDLENISLSFEALLEDGEGETGDYRLLTKGSQWIVIKTSSYISYNHWNSKPEFICSTHQIVSRGRKMVDEDSNVDKNASADGSDRNSVWIESPDNHQISVSSEQTTLNTLLKNNTIPVTCCNMSNSQVSTRTSPYSALQAASTLKRRNEGYPQNSAQQRNSSSEASSQNKDEISQRKRAEFYIDPNSIPISPHSCEFAHELAPTTFETNQQSLSSYWSGHSPSENAGMNGRFQNPLVPKTQSQQNAERHTCPLPNSNEYPQSPRSSQRFTEPGFQISNQYPHFSNENPASVLQTAGHPQKSVDGDFSTRSPQMPQGYFPSSLVNPERNFHFGRRSLSSISSSSLPPSSPGSENYPVTPTTTNVLSLHIEVSSLQSPPPAVITATNSILSPSPSLLPPTSSQHRTMRGHLPDRYTQSPTVASGSPRSSSPYTSPPTPNNSSQSLAPSFRQSSANSQFVVKGTNEAFHPTSSVNEGYSLQSGYIGYSQSPYDYPDRSPQASTTPRERYSQSNIPFHSIQQDSIDHPRSPGQNTQMSPVLPQSVRHDGISNQLAIKSSQLASHNPTSFHVQSNQVYMPSLYHQTQLKKSAEESLQPCQINTDTTYRSPVRTSSGITCGKDYQEQFTTGINKEGRPSAMFSPTRSSKYHSPHDSNDSNRIQTLKCHRQTIEHQDNTSNRYLENQGDETYQVTHEQVIDEKNSTLNSMAPDKSSAYIQAQRILHNQLLDKQNHLHDIILKQKAQLTKIQEQIILNAQAHLSLHEICGLESTKEFQQRVNDLEVERKQHKARQNELKSVFLQKLDGISSHSHRHEGQVLGLGSRITTSQKERSSPLQNVASVSAVNNNGSKTLIPSDTTGNIQRNIGHYYTPAVLSNTLYNKNNPHNKTSPCFVPSQARTNELSNNEDTSLNRDESSKASSSNQAKDYFSKFSSSELETFLSNSSFPSTRSDKNTSDDNVDKEETESPSTLDSLLLQQKRLLELQEEQRNQLVKRQKEQLLLLQQQQQKQQMLLELQHTPDNISPEHNNEEQISQEGNAVAEDPSSLLSHELSDEDLSVVNMLLAEDVGTGLWANEIFDKPTSVS